MQRISFISRQARRPELRALALGASCLLFLGAQGNCGQGSKTTIAPISITINDIDNNPDIATMTQVTRIDNKGSCEYRLEFMAPGDKTRGINEIGGNRPGGAQRINSCTAFPPAFAATSTSNAAWFDEQSTYYWAKKSRDYAKEALWITPPGVNSGSFTLAIAEVSLSVLAGGAYGAACSALGFSSPGCMRYWPGQNPKIYISAGNASRSIVVHEYGHYAAGYVFGHMDTLGSGGFKISNCVHLAFQEGIAETFHQLFVHHEFTSTGKTMPRDIPGLNKQWQNSTCTIGPGVYSMSDPLWEAFTQAAWGTMNAGGSPIIVPWPNAASANRGMMNAFIFALINTRDFRMHEFALTALNHIDKNQAPNIATAVRAIFARHGLTWAANGKPCIENQECASNWCDNGDGTQKTRLCMPAPRTGLGGDLCTHDNQCAANLCFGITTNAGKLVPGTCVAPRPLGATCNRNEQCASTYCDAGPNTGNSNKCMPLGGTGRRDDPCTHNTQCASSNCSGMTPVNGVLQGTCQ